MAIVCLLFPCLLLLGAASVLTNRLWAHTRTLSAQKNSEARLVDTDRYLPMLRLLSDADIGQPADPALRRKLRSQRCDLFREYLGYLTVDYGKLLAGVRILMTESSGDRPDLAKALARNRALFIIAVCRIEFRLELYALGIGSAERLKTDALSLVESLNILRGQISFVESAVWGA